MCLGSFIERDVGGMYVMKHNWLEIVYSIIYNDACIYGSPEEDHKLNWVLKDEEKRSEV